MILKSLQNLSFPSTKKNFVKDRLDKLMFACLNGQKHFELFRKICIKVFTLPHSQCAVEHGFSVKKELLVENI